MPETTLAQQFARNMPTEAGKLLDAYRSYVAASHADARGWAAGTAHAARAHDNTRHAFAVALRNAPLYAVGDLLALALEALSQAKGEAAHA